LNAIKQARGVKDTRISSRFKIIQTLLRRGVPAAIQSDYSHLKVGLIKINTVWPFPEEALQKVAEETKLIIVPEMNMGKYSREVERALKDKIVVSMPKCGGDLHTPQEILDRILEEVGVRESRI
jgi:pyruvate/2-oxoacid:ferredoxin oxidoreductase alpha subunit